MADAIISVVAERLTAILAEPIQNEVSLVRGVKKEARKLSDELRRVRNVLDDAHRREFKDKNIREWLKRLEYASYEMDDVLDEWNFSHIKLQKEQQDSSSVAPPHHKVCPFIPHSSCLSFKKIATRRDIALKIKDVKARLDVILKEKNRYDFHENQETDHSFGKLGRVTTSFAEIEEVKGRDIDRDNLVSNIISHSTSASQGDQLGPFHISSIVGTGGIGKTALAQLVYNDSRVEDCFPLRIWICVSDLFDEARIAREIVEQVQKNPTSTNQLQVLLELVKESISGKKFLLVLDDVWDGDDTKWGPLKSSLKSSCAVGSRILVTTRNERVARNIGTTENEIHHLGQLSDDDCWLVLRRIAFLERSEEMNEELLDIGREIAKKCKGLPLTAKTLGSLLRFKNTAEEWEDILNSEIWQLETTKVDLFPHLLLSYNDLSPAQKRCFSYCAVFSKDYQIEVDDLIRKWMALGYLSFGGGNASELELRGREYFDDLASRSLFQNFFTDPRTNKNVILGCKMHDIVHDFAQFLREGDLKSFDDDRVGTTMLKDASSCKTCSPLLVSRVKEYRSLFLNGETHSDLQFCDCLASVRVLEFQNFRNMSKGIEKLIHLRYLSFFGININENDVKTICMLYNLQSLLLMRCDLGEIPSEIGNLTQLRHLDLSRNEDLTELPKSISDLHELRSLDVSHCQHLKELPESIRDLHELRILDVSHCKNLKELPESISDLHGLRSLDVSYCKNLKELPESMSDLHELISLDLSGCESLSGFPQGIDGLIKLKHLDSSFRVKYPQGLAKLTSLQTLTTFHGGSDSNKLGFLKKLNRLSGDLRLVIKLVDDDDDDDIVEQAREAELRKKMHLQKLEISFQDSMDEKNKEEEVSMRRRLDVLDALEPHPNLQSLIIGGYRGSKFPKWIASPVHQLREIRLFDCYSCSSLPHLGKLPCLKKLMIFGKRGSLIPIYGNGGFHIGNRGFQFVGREFLGITSSSSSSSSIGFPKLKSLEFRSCSNWKEWEDITAEEEESAAVLVMPCLTELTIRDCNRLTALPHRLLRKASSLQNLIIWNSIELKKSYKEGPLIKFISHIPKVEYCDNYFKLRRTHSPTRPFELEHITSSTFI